MFEYHGCPAGRFIMTSVAISDCLPEAFKILAYAHRKWWVDALSASMTYTRVYKKTKKTRRPVGNKI